MFVDDTSPRLHSVARSNDYGGIDSQIECQYWPHQNPRPVIIDRDGLIARGATQSTVAKSVVVLRRKRVADNSRRTGKRQSLIVFLVKSGKLPFANIYRPEVFLCQINAHIFPVRNFRSTCVPYSPFYSIEDTHTFAM